MAMGSSSSIRPHNYGRLKPPQYLSVVERWGSGVVGVRRVDNVLSVEPSVTMHGGNALAGVAPPNV